MPNNTAEFWGKLKPKFKGKAEDYQAQQQTFPSGYHEVVRCTYQGSECVAKIISYSYRALSVSNILGIQEFEKEMLYLQELDHPNVIKLLAVIELGEDHLAAILPYANQGTLGDFFNNPSYSQISWDTRYKFALDLTKGLSYLHSQGILHLDLRPPNVLVNYQTGSYRLMISDLGNSRQRPIAEMYKEKEEETVMKVDPVFVALELMGPDPVMSAKADIFSLGILLWCISEHKYPTRNVFFAACGISYDFTTQGFFGNRFRRETPPAYRSIVSSCWVQNPRLRPKADFVSDNMSALQSESDVDYRNSEIAKLV